MEQNHNNPSTNPQNITVIEWDNFNNHISRLSSLSSALNDSKNKKQLLHHKLQSLINVHFYFYFWFSFEFSNCIYLTVFMTFIS
ncbi:hypothetical protein Lalb_Chr21g0313031 [Lupinus albus]|uniref:Uncharacterized protein n=1 Tax=Lupinus albus TaxID=3870 RepID=A0A6A4NG67_LUPAL|nr:hypothetical protein Lalb_Chr21g0313031 [Lupinus albus]